MGAGVGGGGAIARSREPFWRELRARVANVSLEEMDRRINWYREQELPEAVGQLMAFQFPGAASLGEAVDEVEALIARVDAAILGGYPRMASRYAGRHPDGKSRLTYSARRRCYMCVCVGVL